MSKPYIYGAVNTEEITPVHFIIITSNGFTEVAHTMLDGWVACANHNARQLAMSCCKASVFHGEPQGVVM